MSGNDKIQVTSGTAATIRADLGITDEEWAAVEEEIQRARYGDADQALRAENYSLKQEIAERMRADFAREFELPSQQDISEQIDFAQELVDLGSRITALEQAARAFLKAHETFCPGSLGESEDALRELLQPDLEDLGKREAKPNPHDREQ